ncbi:cytochrome P450 [Russula earlei]|uniref:Cytochrome P450 n=1 Tax=Russula earlei TaxID=71964 RepID=A0ACC0U7Q6_9AGAM|nr:cytochrome P450 [Russula earlei]
MVDFLAIFAFLYLLLDFRDHRRRRGLPYPPGPFCWPVIGNLLDVPKLSPWVAYADMSKKHGDIMYFRVFGQVIVVLCSLTAIKELLEKRGDLYADRPRVPIFEIMEMDWTLPLLRKGEYWRKNRLILDRALRPGAVASYRSMIEEKTRLFLGQLLTTPKDFRAHIDFLQGKIIMSLTYGYELEENDDILVPTRKTGEIMSQLAVPGAALVNHLPILRYTPSWVPLFKYEPMASICRELGKRMINEPIDYVKNAMREGTAVASLASEQLEEVEKLSGPERQRAEKAIKQTLGSLFQGARCTVSSMSSLFIALALYPEVQKRAQAELDSILSRDRLPTFEDKPRLPYIEAMCKELARWQMVTPMGVPHASTHDDVYRGFFIPKGSIHYLLFVKAVLHNPDLYPDPETFKPERFLNEDGTFRDDPTIALAFGVGKRICPGRHLVEATLFVFISSVLSVFHVTKAKDEYGNEIPVKINTLVEGQITLQPTKFECSITVRDKMAEDLIKANIWT